MSSTQKRKPGNLFFHLLLFKRMFLPYLILISLVLLFVLGLDAANQFDVYHTLLFILFFIIYLILIYVYLLRPTRSALRNLCTDKIIHYELDDTYLSIHTDKSLHSFEWSITDKALESSSYFFIESNKNFSFLLPKSAFNGEDHICQCREILQKKLGKKFIPTKNRVG